MSPNPILNKSVRIIFNLLFVLSFCFISNKGLAQGRVLINEYLSWPANACSVTSEYIELYNFGPGPLDLGCYVLTDGDYSITIPPNTIILPGQFFVIAGQNTIPLGCANSNQTVPVNLNWNTCNCTSSAIPTTGDGLMTDGGSGSEQLVLFDPSFKIVDAIVRNLSESSSPITTSTVGGQCAAYSFDLDTMNISYEVVGESQGRANSFARRVNGGCGWLKDPQQSGGATNNTPGASSELDATLTITTPFTCSQSGAATVSVQSGNYNEIFPMNYIIAKDIDSNGIYNFSDNYFSGIDSSSNTIVVNNLTQGIYRMVVETSKGCDLTSFNFNILNCHSVLLEIPFTFFEIITANNRKLQLKWNVGDRENLSSFIIQKSVNGFDYVNIGEIRDILHPQYVSSYFLDIEQASLKACYRILSISKQGQATYSSVKISVDINNLHAPAVYPNPFQNSFFVSVNAPHNETFTMNILDLFGKRVQSRRLRVNMGINEIPISTHDLKPGIYIIQWSDDSHKVYQSTRLIKTSK